MRRLASAPARLLLFALAGCAGLGSGCRTEGPAATISADEANATESSRAGEPKNSARAGTAARPESAFDRELWFAEGPARDAILARERKDHAAAVRLLDAALAQDLSADERAGVQWLRALEDLTDGRHAEAAERLAQAAAAPALRPLRARLVRLEAQARLDAGEPHRALARLQTVPMRARVESGLEEAYAVLEADALLRTGARERAQHSYEGYLREYPRGSARLGVSAKLARMLATRGDAASVRRAVELYETLLLEAPVSDYGEEAAEALPELRKAAGLRRSRAEASAFEREVALARLDALLGRRRYTQAAEAADALLKGSPDAATRCRALYSKGSAIFKKRRRTEARPVFERAARACKGTASLATYEVRSRYQAARGLYAEGKYAAAAAGFTSLAEDHPRSTYADDAWVLAGESWAEGGDEDRSRRAFEAAVAIEGDQADEARRRLLLQAFASNDARRALGLADASLLKRLAGPADEAKLRYFRGRALVALGQPEAAQAAYVRAVSADPLGYSAVLAMSRLHELGREPFELGLASLQRSGPSAVDLSVGEGAHRAVLLAQLGLGDDARDELRVAGVRGWPAVAVLNQAGLYAEAQRTVANLGTSWRQTPPGSANLAYWELAHPRPFAELVERYEAAHGVPDLLGYAVMQTESRFNPGATSWAGARGLIQLMPSTAQGVARKAGIVLEENSLYSPATNLELGLRHLSGLIERYEGGPGAVALAVPSYNAGSGAVDRWLAERGSWDLDLFLEAIPYDETRRYTQAVVGRWWAYRWLYCAAPPRERVPLLPRATPSRR